MSSHTALGPNAHFVTNMPAIDTPMADVGDIDVPPAVVTSGHGEDQQNQAIGGDRQHEQAEEVVQPRWCSHN